MCQVSILISLDLPQILCYTYLELNKGDMVQHDTFGTGMILSALPVGNDAMLEIAFDQVGTKRLMAKAASVRMKKL